jgi:dTDP-4-amino-4,6-dideoxygalactose transaminase
MAIPFVDLNAQYTSIKSEIDAAIAGTIERGDFILGQSVSAFEEEFAQLVGASHAIGVASGTDALNLAVEACDIGPGDEVITVPNTWISTAFAATRVGAKVVLVDIDPNTHQMDIEALRGAVTDKTKTIIPVHLFGHPASVDQIVEIASPRNIKVIEDVAQSPLAECAGQKVGSIGDIGCYSFYPSKNLGCYGDGGCITVNDAQLANRIRAMRNYGQEQKHTHLSIGANSRLDTMQASVLQVKLKHLPKWTEMRRSNAIKYNQALAHLPVRPVSEPGNAKSVYHLYVIEMENRDECIEFLLGRGINAQIHYPTPIHLQPCYEDLGYKPGDFPVAENAMQKILSLPMYPEITEEQIHTVADAMTQFFNSTA